MFIQLPPPAGRAPKRRSRLPFKGIGPPDGQPFASKDSVAFAQRKGDRAAFALTFIKGRGQPAAW
ncbi:hypothetical protein BOS5A_230467 [Bosea sp. EC-HK365B]|nr:hypothetical protein BOSE7B_60122 [Bosea sp. 7B]VVT61190.1 hypothetical protein BOS5A_230467 [Bosea sp. EC-HK365B]